MTQEQDFLRLIKDFNIHFNGRTEGDGSTTIQLQEQSSNGVVQFIFNEYGTFTNFERKG